MALTFVIQNFKKHSFRRRNRRANLQIDFAERLTAARSIVVCLPQEKEYFDAFIGPLGKMKQIFPHAHITLVFYKNHGIPAAYHQRFNLVEWHEQDIDRHGVPRSSLLKRIFDKG